MKMFLATLLIACFTVSAGIGCCGEIKKNDANDKPKTDDKLQPGGTETSAGQAAEAAAVKMIEELGGKVRVDDKRPGKPVVAVSLEGTKVTDAGLKELKELKSLRSLYLMHTKVTDAGVKELQAALPRLRIAPR